MKRKALLAPASLSAAAAANAAPDGANPFRLQGRSTSAGQLDEANNASGIGIGNISRLRGTTNSNQAGVFGTGGGGMTDVINGMDANKVERLKIHFIFLSISCLRLLGRAGSRTDTISHATDPADSYSPEFQWFQLQWRTSTVATATATTAATWYARAFASLHVSISPATSTTATATATPPF